MADTREKTLINRILEKWSSPNDSHRAWVGLDGYVDKIQHPVKSQEDSRSIYYPTLSSFAQRIRSAAGKSAQVELDTQNIKAGGNAPIMANALACLGITNTCVGTFGEPTIHPVFKELHEDCQLVSLGHAAETNALEFKDGKIMLSELSAFQHLDWAFLRNKIALYELIAQTGSCSLIALVDWCNLPHATDIWRGFFQHVVKDHIRSRPQFFFDLTDPTKKPVTQISEVISLINQFAHYGEVTLGLNENESIKLAGSIGWQVGDMLDMKAVGTFLFDHLSIHRIIIHPVDCCFVFTSEQQHHLQGRLVRQPAVATGGGDNFNAGFYFGMLNGFSQEESLILAMATSGAYVQQGTSPSQHQLRLYLQQWYNEL